MFEVGLFALIVAVGLFSVIAVRSWSLGPNTYWVWACVALFGNGASNFAFVEAPALAPVGYAFGTAYPALLLAGALAYAERRVPSWLVAAALAAGALRGVLGLVGEIGLSQGVSLVSEPTASLVAAAVVLRADRGRAVSWAQRGLVPGLVVIAALDAATTLASPPGVTLPGALLALWALFTPFLLALQISATSQQTQAVLQRARDQLEQRVQERTAELGRSVADLEAEIAERRAAESALRESEERYRTVSELSSDYSFAMRVDRDLSMRIEWVTDAFFRITGYAPAELQDRGWLAIIDPGDRGEYQAHFKKVLAGQSDVLRTRILTKSGDERWLEVRFGTRHDEADGAVRIVGAASDVTERVAAERERRRLDQHMQEVQRFESLGVMAGGIAHDFNNVLTVILGNARLSLAELGSGSPLRRRLSRIQAAAEYASGLTGQMLTYSGKGSLELHPMDLSQVARDMLDLLRASSAKKSSLDVELATDLPAVEGDETQIRQVILNLVSNASQALAEPGGRIDLRTGVAHLKVRDLADAFGTLDPAPGEYVYLEVADTGEGIGVEQQARVFEPFFTTKRGGRGLGLASVLGIVTAHRGVITLESRPGKGATFRVLLPRSSRAAESKPAVARPDREVRRSGTILVVDDDEWVLDLAREFLQRAGFTVLTAPGGRAGVDLVRARGDEIDAVVLDLIMPEMNGEEAFEEMRRIRPDLQVVLASGYGKEMSPERFFARGVAGVLFKPYEPEELVQRVVDALTRSPVS